jgi:hypothetical protein
MSCGVRKLILLGFLLRLYALNVDGATIKASVPRIFNNECP